MLIGQRRSQKKFSSARFSSWPANKKKRFRRLDDSNVSNALNLMRIFTFAFHWTLIDLFFVNSDFFSTPEKFFVATFDTTKTDFFWQFFRHHQKKLSNYNTQLIHLCKSMF